MRTLPVVTHQKCIPVLGPPVDMDHRPTLAAGTGCDAVARLQNETSCRHAFIFVFLKIARPAPLCGNSVLNANFSASWSVKGILIVQFIFGVLAFVIVIGWIDAKLPWPNPRTKDLP